MANHVYFDNPQTRRCTDKTISVLSFLFFFVVGLQFNDPLKEDLEMFKENQHFRYYRDITEAKTVLDYINTNSAAKHKHQVRIRREVNLKYPC